MRSCSMALQLLSTALGSYLGGGVVAAVQAASTRAGAPWLPKDLNKGRLDCFFLLTAALMAANALLFAWVASGYEYKSLEHKRAVAPAAGAAAEAGAAAGVEGAAARAAAQQAGGGGGGGLLAQQLAAAAAAAAASGAAGGAGAGAPLPPAAPARGGVPVPGAPRRGMAIGPARRGRYPPGARRPRRDPGAGGADEDGGEDGGGGGDEVYARSLAYMPASPALPAPFR